jgi:hypothetical protein
MERRRVRYEPAMKFKKQGVPPAEGSVVGGSTSVTRSESHPIWIYLETKSSKSVSCVFLSF